jgi:amino acid transporter
LVFALAGFIALICTTAFGMMSRHYRSDENGGAYIFTRKTNGQFFGLLAATLTYVAMPLIIM